MSRLLRKAAIISNRCISFQSLLCISLQPLLTDASAVIYSLMLTCRVCDVEPYAYLRHVLTELPKRQPGADVVDLLRFNFATA